MSTLVIFRKRCAAFSDDAPVAVEGERNKLGIDGRLISNTTQELASLITFQDLFVDADHRWCDIVMSRALC